jgi:hypothetical protein
MTAIQACNSFRTALGVNGRATALRLWELIVPQNFSLKALNVIGMYLDSSSISSTLGTAGSLAIILIWVFYSAQILLIGAEFTQVYAKHCRAPIRPSKHAVRISE